MRRWIKQEVLEMAHSLKQAHGEIENAIKCGNIVFAQYMLNECQECAIELGNNIEKSEGKEHKTILFLEDYCEALFFAYKEIGDGYIVNHDFLKDIKNKLLKVENSIECDIVIKKEIVFFPYNVSMWDSLESVYLKEKISSQNNVYCVPIPYYDLNSNGSFGQMHYEGFKYPKNIEVLDWRTYCFEERKPDVIYIHNPYDNYNLVTSVHPRFYSGNLKKYTDKLVYIPYFVLGEIEADEQEKIESMKHFIWLPGVINADQVVLQSEKMKQIYINEYMKEAKSNGLSGKHIDINYLEQKFQGIGSPKIDRILNIKRDRLKLPEEWIKVIGKGRRSKKILLYNTGLTSLLQYEDRWLDKIEDVLKILKRMRDKVILLWRPHPLIESTMKAMRPAMLKKYMEIKSTYKEEGWGIFDDTPDIDRAIILCDAYYGDESSVTMLCRQKNKPVMIQDVNLLKKNLWECVLEQGIKIPIEDAVLHKDRIWFSATNFNSLFSMDVNTGKVVLVGEFPDESYNGNRLYASMELINEQIYFIPMYAKKIAVFDIKTSRFYNIALEEKMINCKKGNPRFMGSERFNKYIFVLPVYARAIVRLNTENNKVEYITEWLNQIERIIFNPKDAYFRKQVYIKEDKLIVPFCNVNAVLELDCYTMESVVHKLGTLHRGYSGICYDGINFWLSPRESEDLIRWNPQTDEKKVIEICKTGYKKHPLAYVGVLYYDNKIILFPTEEEKSMIIKEKGVMIADGKYSIVEEKNNIFVCFRKDLCELHIFDHSGKKKIITNTIINRCDFDFERLLKENRYIIYEQMELNIMQLIGFL